MMHSSVNFSWCTLFVTKKRWQALIQALRTMILNCLENNYFARIKPLWQNPNNLGFNFFNKNSEYIYIYIYIYSLYVCICSLSSGHPHQFFFTLYHTSLATLLLFLSDNCLLNLLHLSNWTLYIYIYILPVKNICVPSNLFISYPKCVTLNQTTTTVFLFILLNFSLTLTYFSKNQFESFFLV